MDVLRRLGLIDVRVVTRKRPAENYGVWSFDVEPFLTQKGAELASGGREDQDAPSLRLADKVLVEVTGITKAGSQAAQAEYTWKESPTAAGRASSPAALSMRACQPHCGRRSLSATRPKTSTR